VNEDLLIYVEDPGAANWVVPLIPALTRQGPSFALFCESGLATYFEARGVKATILDPSATARDLINTRRPQLVVVGTSENLASRGLALIDAAKQAGIPSASFVDQEANAEHRYRGRSSDPLAHAPDWLFVSDKNTRQAFAALGFRDSHIIVSGNPHLDRVRDVAQSLAQEGRDKVRSRVAPEAPQDAPIVVFIAEIGYVVNPEAENWEKNLNFHGRDGTAPRCARILEEVLDALRGIDPAPWFILRLHPKNQAEEFEAYTNEIDQLSAGGDPLGLLWAADLVVGMSSAPLEEAHTMGRPVLSVLPHPIERDWLPSLASGDIALAENRQTLRNTLPPMVTRTTETKTPHAGAESALDRICDALTKMAQAA